MIAYGVDGCPAGWFYVGCDADGLTHGIVREFSQLLEQLPANAHVFVDIPIGLRDTEAAARGCDSAARKLLSRRASSVFNAPLREILEERDYPAANARSRDLCGKGLSKQSFYIMPKIREVDALMRDSEHARAIVRESHPELCFWGLSGGAGLQHGKKSALGFSERLALLESLDVRVTDLVEEALGAHKRRDLARDDVLDACVLALTAAGAVDLRTAPASPETDSSGLPMEIVYGYREPINDNPAIHSLSAELLPALDAHLERHYLESPDDGYFMPYARNTTDAASKPSVEAARQSVNEPGWRRWFIAREASTGRVIGHACLQGGQLSSELHRCSLGIGIERGYRGQGLGTRLMQAAINLARRQSTLTWIDLWVFAHNEGAHALYRRLGFSEIGRAQDRFRMDGQQVEDIAMTLRVN